MIVERHTNEAKHVVHDNEMPKKDIYLQKNIENYL